MPSTDADLRSRIGELRELIAVQQQQQQAAMDEIERLLPSEEPR